jgi:hypothetical protein
LLSYGARDFPEAQALFPQFYHPLSNVLFWESLVQSISG